MNWIKKEKKIVIPVLPKTAFETININVTPQLSPLPLECSCGDPYCSINSNTSTNTNYGSKINITQINCKLCGKKFKSNIINTSFFNDDLKFCKDCKKLLVKKIASLFIPKDSKVHCFKCMSHINACECDTKKAIDNLKK